MRCSISHTRNTPASGALAASYRIFVYAPLRFFLKKKQASQSRVRQVATKSWSGGTDGESSSAQAQEVSVRRRAGQQAEQSFLPCTTRPGRECGGRQITRGDSDAVVLLPVGASPADTQPQNVPRVVAVAHWHWWSKLQPMGAIALLPAWIGTRRLLPRRRPLFLLVRALCFTYTDHAMQFGGIRLRPVCPPLRCRFGKPKVWSGLDGRFFSFTHIGPVGIIDDGLQKTATTVGPNLVTPVGFRPYASGLAWPGLDPALFNHPAPAYVWSTRRWLVNFPAGKYDRCDGEIAAPRRTWTIILPILSNWPPPPVRCHRGPWPVAA